MKCKLCERDKPESQGVFVPLTEEQRAILKAMDAQDTTEAVFYCKPCHNVLSNPEQGAKVLSGLAETKLRLRGMAPAHAERLGDQMYKLLIEKTKAKKEP
jgi:hypothetical protein